MTESVGSFFQQPAEVLAILAETPVLGAEEVKPPEGCGQNQATLRVFISTCSTGSARPRVDDEDLCNSWHANKFESAI